MDSTSEKKEVENSGSATASPPRPTVASTLTDAENETEDSERQARELKAGLHPLKHKFVFWYTRRTPGVRSQTSYEDNIKKIVEFSTVEGFWVCYCHLARPSSLPSPTDLHLFKEGIRPLWEDAANCNGGKWIIRFKKVVSGRFWEDLVLALVGDQLDYGDNICGAVLSIRFNEDILSVWNRNASDHQVFYLPAFDIFNLFISCILRQLELFLSSATVCLTLYSLVAGIFGMNIPYSWNDGHGYIDKWVIIFGGASSLMLFISIIYYAKHKSLIGS